MPRDLLKSRQGRKSVRAERTAGAALRRRSAPQPRRAGEPAVSRLRARAKLGPLRARDQVQLWESREVAVAFVRQYAREQERGGHRGHLQRRDCGFFILF